MPKALGLVETRGLVAAIEAADAMVKASNVTLIGKEVTKPALITIKIVGDVAAVKASVDAGAAAAARVGELVSIHVIPQPDSQMTALFPEIADDDDPGGGRKPKPDRKKKTDSDNSSSKSKPAEAVKNSVTEISSKEEKPEDAESAVKEKGEEAVTAVKPSAAEKPVAERIEGSAGRDISSSEKGSAGRSTEDKFAGAERSTGNADISGRPVPAGKTASKKVRVSKPVKSRAPKPKKEQESENLFSVNLDHLERLRREALGIKEPGEEKPQTKKSAEKPAKKPTAETPVKSGAVQGQLSMEELEKLNVHNLRKAARAMEGFPIQGREISRANRSELLDLFRKII